MPSPTPSGLPAVLYFSKKRSRTASGTSPALWMCTSAPWFASSVIVTVPPSGEASTAFFTRFASIE